eukprot:NODE_1284_length_1566_cov_79.544128_g1213_i0.p1 GENE.NODE_1284_length_1566_cov_79.544128_g1213_i0~~NODE_1284_length_1566_cov_79.544128_g1213_i0.p1  ORF type:complete len:497 (-),score=118.68 NODE_1284_length_1566_cov_79.544128_g1213_i0:75-1532(-)
MAVATMEGQLWKFSEARFSEKGWKDRWYRAEEKGLACYETSAAPRATTVIPWPHVVRLHCVMTADDHPNAIEPEHFYFGLTYLASADHCVLLLRAPSPDVREEWLEAIAHNMPNEAHMDDEEEEIQSPRIKIPELMGKLGSKAAKFGNAALNSLSEGVMEGITRVKGEVSQHKVRFTKDGFNLDLTYITPQIIAMGFPATGAEAKWRNSRENVEAFMSFYHKDKFLVINLCAERSYPASSFEGHFQRHPFEDHNPPPLDLLRPLCESIHKHLANADHVVALHCKAGKGRTGTAIAAYLLFSGHQPTAEAALRFFDTHRTSNGKGVMVPSQRRYVNYFQVLLKQPPPPMPIVVRTVRMYTTPPGGCIPYITISQRAPFTVGMVPKQDLVFDSRTVELPYLVVNAPYVEWLCSVPLQGDLKLMVCLDGPLATEHLCHVWANTAMLPAEGEVCFPRAEIDGPHKANAQSKFPPHFALAMWYQCHTTEP